MSLLSSNPPLRIWRFSSSFSIRIISHPYLICIRQSHPLKSRQLWPRVEIIQIKLVTMSYPVNVHSNTFWRRKPNWKAAYTLYLSALSSSDNNVQTETIKPWYFSNCLVQEHYRWCTICMPVDFTILVEFQYIPTRRTLKCPSHRLTRGFGSQNRCCRRFAGQQFYI